MQWRAWQTAAQIQPQQRKFFKGTKQKWQSPITRSSTGWYKSAGVYLAAPQQRQSKVARNWNPHRRHHVGLITALIGAILGGLGPGGIGFGRSDVVIPYLKKHVYESVVADMTEAVATQVYEQVRPQLANHLIHTLAESVMEALQISLTHAIEHSVGNTVSVATTHGVKTMLTTMCKLNDNLYFPAISNLFQI